MRKKNIDFQSQMKNSEQFLQKLQNIQKASKQMKDKNKLTTHRNIWVKEQKYLNRLERDAQFELTQYLQNFDRYFQYQYEEKQIFGNTNFKNFSSLKKSLDQQYDVFAATAWAQVSSLPILLQKIKKAKKIDLNMQDIQNIVGSIKQFLIQVGQAQQVKLAEMSNKSNIILERNQEQEQQFEDIVYNIKPIFDDVKGFDFEHDRYKKIQEGEQNLIDYLHSMTNQLSQDEISEVIGEFHHASTLLHQALELEIEKINLDYEQALSLDHETLGVSENFHKINHFYQIYLGRGKSVSLYYERLAIQFPKINRKILERITAYIQAKIYKDKKIKTAKRNYLRQKEQIFYKVEKQVNLRIETKIQQAQKEAQMLNRKQQKLRLQKQLEGLRKEYEERQAEKNQKKKQQEDKMKDKQRQRQAIRKLYLDDLSKRAQQVHQIKSQKQKQIENLNKLKRQQQEQLKKKKIQENKPKVNYRHSVDRKKIEKKLQVKQAKIMAPIKKEERINKAIQKYAFRPVIPASQQRLNAPTEHMVIKMNTKLDKADKVQLSKVDGYTVNQLMSDMRYRLNVAFQQAGLHQTEYARQVINKMSKRPDQN